MSAAPRIQHKVLLLEPDAERRALLARELGAAGFAVTAVGRIAEIERWPADEIVITHAHQFTGWWKRVGAAHVIVLAKTPEEGMSACVRGATGWMPYDSNPSVLVTVMRVLVSSDASPASTAR